MTVLVLDNSVAMRGCFDSGKHPYADSILRQLAAPGGEAVVLILWRSKGSSVLARAEITGQLTAKSATEFLDLTGKLPVSVDDEASRRILSDVHRLAVSYRLTSYDAAYLEITLRRGLPLATVDAEPIKACAGAGVGVLKPRLTPPARPFSR